MAEKEYIERDRIVEFIENGLNNPDKAEAFGHDAVEILAEIHLAPAADVVEVVRCEHCKHATFYSCKNDACYRGIICEFKIGTGDENFYCSYGERKEK